MYEFGTLIILFVKRLRYVIIHLDVWTIENDKNDISNILGILFVEIYVSHFNIPDHTLSRSYVYAMQVGKDYMKKIIYLKWFNRSINIEENSEYHNLNKSRLECQE